MYIKSLGCDFASESSILVSGGQVLESPRELDAAFAVCLPHQRDP